jgi:hypothetical protein
LIESCGGDLRIMLRLLRETLLRARTLPIPQDAIAGAITSVRGDFMSISIEDARWLADIGKHRKHGLPDTDAGSVNRLTRFLDTHFVLYLKNGEKWYDTHPLIREEVAKIIERHGQTAQPSHNVPNNPTAAP